MRPIGTLLATWLCAATAGCAGGALVSGEGPSRLLGGPIAEATGAYGAPDTREALAGGRTRYIWVYRGTRIAPGIEEPPAPTFSLRSGAAVMPTPRSPPRLIEEPCRLTLIADEGDRVVGWRAEGGACIEVLGWPELWRE